MKKAGVLTALLVLSLASHVAAAVRIERPCLVPWPQKVTMRGGSLAAPKSLCIVVAGGSTTRRVAETLVDDLRELGFAPTLTGKSPKIILGLSADKTLGVEGYRLEVDKDIRITAATDTGLFWGTRTLLQLLAKGPGKPIPHLSIADKPLIPLRIVMIDVARQFHSIGFHRRMVKRLASYKLNAYHIHFSDDQSYTLPSEKYPTLAKPGRNYTKDELKDLVKLAGRYHVTIIPEVDMPGHSEALSRAVPEVACREIAGQPICPSSNRSFEILRNLITEVTDIFPGPYFHIGADEVNFRSWEECPDCRARKISESLNDNDSLYNWFINRVNGYVRSKGRTTIVWDGFKTTTRPAVDKNVLVDEWDIGCVMPGDLLAAGYDLINASAAPLYVVRTWSSTPQNVAEWDVWHFGLVNQPPPYLAPEMTPSKRLRGVCSCSWENSEEVEGAVLFGIGPSAPTYVDPAPRVPPMAERAWTGSATTAVDLLERVGATPDK